MSRADGFTAKGNVLKGMSIGLVRARCKAKLCRFSICMKELELSKIVGGIWPGT